MHISYGFFQVHQLWSMLQFPDLVSKPDHINKNKLVECPKEATSR